MFIETQQHPTIEFDPEAGQREPALAHYFSDRVAPFRSALPPMTENDEGERILVVKSPLSELVDWTIKLHTHSDFSGRAVVDQKHRAFFEAVKAALAQATAKLEQIEFVAIDDEEDDGD